MTGQVFVFQGVTDGASGSGSFDLYSEWFYSKVAKLKIPRGTKLKIWGVGIDGNGETKAIVQHSPDDESNYYDYVVKKLASAGETVPEESRRPMPITGKGNDWVKVLWEQPSAVVANVTITAEVEEFDGRA